MVGVVSSNKLIIIMIVISFVMRYLFCVSHPRLAVDSTPSTQFQ